MSASDRGLARHLSTDILAELVEGALTAAEFERATEHLAGCPPCRHRQVDLEAEMAAVSTQLAAAAAAPVAMPVEVSARLRSALRAESDSRAAGSGVAPLAGASNARRTRGRLSRVLLVAAGLVVVAGLAVGVIARIAARQDTDTAANLAGAVAMDRPDESAAITRGLLAGAPNRWPVMAGSTAEQACAIQLAEDRGVRGIVRMVQPVMMRRATRATLIAVQVGADPQIVQALIVGGCANRAAGSPGPPGRDATTRPAEMYRATVPLR